MSKGSEPMKNVLKLSKYIVFLFVLMFGMSVGVSARKDSEYARAVCKYKIGGNVLVTYTVVDNGKGSANVSFNWEKVNSNVAYNFTLNQNATATNFIKDNRLQCPAYVYYKTTTNGRTGTKYDLSFTPGDNRTSTGLDSGSTNNGKPLKENNSSEPGKEPANKYKSCDYTSASGTKVTITVENGQVKYTASDGYRPINSGVSLTPSDFEGKCPQLAVECNSQAGNKYCNIKVDNSNNGSVGQETPDAEEIEEQNKDKDKEEGEDKVVNTGDAGWCGGLGPLKEDIELVWDMIKIIAPILVVVFGSIDYFQAVISSDEKQIKNATTKFSKRLMLAAAIFFIPYAIEVLFAISGVGEGIESAVCGIR